MRTGHFPRASIHALLLCLPLLAAGCARTPDGASDGGGTLVTFQVQLKGAVNPSLYYYVLLDTDNDPSDGPVPVVARPWGNGYAAGSYTHFVLYHAGTFGVYRSSDADHTEQVYLGRPLQAFVTTTNNPSDTLQIQIEAGMVDDANPSVASFDVNVVCTDRVPLDPQDATPKVVDGLGASGNDYVSIPLTFTTSYANGVDPDPGHPEREEAWVTEPSLDMVNWRIVVQTDA